MEPRIRLSVPKRNKNLGIGNIKNVLRDIQNYLMAKKLAKNTLNSDGLYFSL